jgi:hypothetical protein
MGDSSKRQETSDSDFLTPDYLTPDYLTPDSCLPHSRKIPHLWVRQLGKISLSGAKLPSIARNFIANLRHTSCLIAR